MTMVGFSLEKRPLKRPRLGPPDVYPQDAKQREDELTAVNVKQGFSHLPIADEFGSAKNCSISSAKLGAFINGTVSRKMEINILPDTGKRRVQVNTKDHFWPVTPRLKSVVDTWMKDLASGKSLSVLGKKVPIFNKREEIFLNLCEHNVPMLRAAWFLKMTASYNSAISEAKTKKRQLPDPSQEWTISLQRFLKDILIRLSDWYNGTSSNPIEGSGTPTQSQTFADEGNIVRQWNYCTDLAKHLYEEGLLDRYEWLQFVIDACDKAKTIEDASWKALIPLLCTYIPEIAQSELLARRLAHLAARRISTLFSDFDTGSSSPQNSQNQVNFQPPAILLDHLQCLSHRSTVLALVSALQVVCLECPTAMVYNANGIGNSSSNGSSTNSSDFSSKLLVPQGSPLDLIPIPPSALPMPPRSNNPVIRMQLRVSEELIRHRSIAVEEKWSCEEWQQSSAATTLQKVLSALDALDKHNFDKVETNNSLDSLYSKIFPNPPSKENPNEDAPIVLLLCQWAVGTQRTGEHRALVVSKILEHRQTDALSSNDPEGKEGGVGSNEIKGENSGDDPMNGGGGGGGIEGEGGGNSSSGNGVSNSEEESESSGLPIYHNLLFKFLDNDAPILDETSPQSKSTFASLVHLFGALIRHDIFSHDAYLCTLVARGDLSTTSPGSTNSSSSSSGTVVPSVTTPGPGSQIGPGTPASVSSVPPTPHHDSMDDRGPLFPPLPRLPDVQSKQPDYNDHDNIDDDLDRILQHITQEQNNMDQVDSPKEDAGFNNSSNSGGGEKGGGLSPSQDSDPYSKAFRHRLYATHFPLPVDESFQHEINQRQILLYGVGRMRDDARHVVKKVSKELGKLLSKKFCYDVTDGSRLKKHSRNEINLENLQAKFAALTYFDQNSLTCGIISSLIEMFSSFAGGRSNYLPTTEHFAFLTELMEMAYNINGLVETCSLILRELTDVEIQLQKSNSPIAGNYTSSLLLQLVAVLRRFHSPLLCDLEMTQRCWEGLTRLMKRFLSFSECTSAERCTLAYLTELQSCCHFLRTKQYTEALTTIGTKFRPGYGNHQSAEGTHGWNNTFMTQCLDNPRKKVDSSYVRQLIEIPSCRYSFVCNAILSICNEVDAERLNDLALLCAEMTAACPSLANEWLSMLQTICSPSRHVTSFGDVLREKVKDLSIHSSLASLTALLVARQCFSLENFVIQAVPSLLKAWNDGRGPNDPDIEAGARLTCQLLLSLFKTQDITNSAPSVLKLCCDRRLLSATHNSISLGPLTIVLKAILLIADAAGSGERRREQRNIPGITQGELSLILGTSDVPSENRSEIRGEPRTLASFALNALQQMCSETWIKQKCLQNLEELCTTDHLLDPIISPKQAQRLLHLICYPDMPPLPDESLGARTLIPRIMFSLDQWNLREAWLGLTLQSKQLASSNASDYSNWLDITARATIEVFNLEEGSEFLPSQHSTTPSPAPAKSPRNGGKKQQDKTPPSSGPTTLRSLSEEDSDKIHRNGSAWLIAPLVSRLSPHVQGRVIRRAANVLENTLGTRSKKPNGLHGHLPFLALILTCLKGQEERENLLSSLLTQFSQIISLLKEPESEEGSKGGLRDALRFRLSLVGALFEAIQRSSTATAEWAVVLTQLVTNGVVDLETNPDVYPTVIDMVTALVHSTQVTEPGERVEEMRKQNLNLIKKLKKELMDRNSDSVKPLRQLLPLSKIQSEIIVTQPTSTIVDSKGNRKESFEFLDKKPGLAVWEKQKVSPWELLEGQRNPAPLSWAWFGAVKMERKPLKYEEAFKFLKYHSHSMVKPSSHFLEPVPLPPEDIDVKKDPYSLEKDELMGMGLMSMKPDTPSSDQSPRGPATNKRPKAARKKRQTKAQQQAAQAAAAQQQQQQANLPPVPPPNVLPPPPPINANATSPYGVGGPGPGPPPNYPPGPPGGQWNQGPQNPNYYPQPPQGQGQQGVQQPGARPINNQSKQALHNLLRARHPGTGPGQNNPQYGNFPPQQGQVSGPGQGGPGMPPQGMGMSGPGQQQVPPPQQQQQQQQGVQGPRHQILRQQLRGPTPVQNFQPQGGMPGGPPNAMAPQGGGGMYPQNTMGHPQQHVQQPPQQQPNYGGYPPQGQGQGNIPVSGGGIPPNQIVGMNPGQGQQMMNRPEFHPNVGVGRGRGGIGPRQGFPPGAQGMMTGGPGGNYGQIRQQGPPPGGMQGMQGSGGIMVMGGGGGQMVVNQGGMVGNPGGGGGGMMGQNVPGGGGGVRGPMPPNMPNNTQRLRQIMAMQQQQQQQQQGAPGMPPRGPMQQHYNPNQPGGY